MLNLPVVLFCGPVLNALELLQNYSLSLVIPPQTTIYCHFLLFVCRKVKTLCLILPVLSAAKILSAFFIKLKMIVYLIIISGRSIMLVERFL